MDNDKRNDWIRRRSTDRYDWTGFLLAMSQLTTYGGEDGHGLVVDLSAIAPKHYPERAQLDPGPNGWWSHAPSGVSGPLFEVLSSLVLSCIEADSPYEPTPDSPVESPDTRETPDAK